VKEESMRAIGISILGVGIALMITAVAGCTIRQSSAQPASQQAGSNSSPGPVEGLCKSPDVPPADVARKPGYRQFDVSVTDSTGWPISGLKQQDFVLYAGSQTFPVAYFREHKNDEPVAIALVVDTSGSMISKLPIVQQSLGDFVKNLNRCDEVIIFAFSSRPFVLLPFSTDHQMAAQRMELLRADGKSALYDATYTALQSLEGADYPNRKLILITDGIDNSSAASEKEVVAEATKEGVPIYAVGIGDPNAPEKSHTMGSRYVPMTSPYVAMGPSSVVGGPSYIGGVHRLAWSGTDWVDAKSLEDLSATAGGQSFIVPARGQHGGKSFETAVFAIADNIAKGYTLGAVVPADVTPSTVKATVVKRLDLDVRAHPIAAAP
jgi:VWFA-related protein